MTQKNLIYEARNSMIRIIRILSILLFILSLGAYGGITMYNRGRVDLFGPKITMDSDTVEVSIRDKDSAILAGVTASDPIDGDVSDSMIVESMSNFIAPFTREVVIAAFDNSGNVTKATRTVVYTDYREPKVKIESPMIANISNTSVLLEGITVTDCLDGDITDHAQLSSTRTISNTDSSEYLMHLVASNSAGDTLDLPLTVNLYAGSERNMLPQIELTEYLIYSKTGEKVKPTSYLKSITSGADVYNYNTKDKRFVCKIPKYEHDGTISEDNYIPVKSVKISHNIDIYNPGVYEAVYTYENANHRTGLVRLVVVIEGEPVVAETQQAEEKEASK